MTVQWSAGSGVAEYYLGVGTSQAAIANTPWGNIFADSVETKTSQWVSGIPLTGKPVFVRLWWRIGTTWSSTDYTYQTQGGGGGGDPAITSPTPGSTVTSSTMTVQWNAGSAVDEYWLGVGTSQAAIANTPWGNIFADSVETKTSQWVSGIPLTGKPVFVRLWWRIGTTWFYTDSTYQTQKDRSTPSLVRPLPGSTLTSSTMTVQWNAGSAVDEYWLGVGTSQAAIANTPWGNIFADSVETKTSQWVSDIPLTGKPVFVRLWWRIGTTWFYTDYTYQTQRDDSTPWMVSPSADSTLTTSTATFQWSTGHTVEKYYLGVGTSQAAIANTPWGDIFAQSSGTNTSQVVSGIPLTGKPVFVRLWWKRGTTWLFTDYTYQTQRDDSTPWMVSPSADSTLTTSTATFQWSTGHTVEKYYLGVGTSQAAIANTPWGNIFAQSSGTNTSQVVSGIPLTGKPVFVRLWWKRGTTWLFTDYTYQTQEDE